MPNIRLDKYVLLETSFLSRTQIQNMIKTGKILVNGKKSKCSQIITKEDKVEIPTVKNQNEKIKKENINLEILYENKEYLVINKQAGIVVHPGEGKTHQKGTIVNAILDKISKKMLASKDKEQTKRPGIVHRLDKDTSGALIIAKTEFAYNFFIQQFKERKVKKEYIALIFGKPIHAEGKIDSPIGRSNKNRKKMTIGSTGKEAITEYETKKTIKIEENLCVSLVKIKIPTGRTHQIRVHFSAIGHPVVGDTIYGNKKLNEKFQEKFQIQIQFLHAEKISFVPPREKSKKTITAPLPKEMNKIITTLKKEPQID